jgi:hypothetical protein
MRWRSMAAKVALVGLVAGTSVAIAAAPAAAMMNRCDGALVRIDYWQYFMENAGPGSPYTFQQAFQGWLTATNDVSRYC